MQTLLACMNVLRHIGLCLIKVVLFGVVWNVRQYKQYREYWEYREYREYRAVIAVALLV